MLKNTKKHLKIAALVAAVAAIPLSASADTLADGWYAQGQGGWALTPDVKAPGARIKYNRSLSDAYSFAGALGYKSGPVRYALQYLYAMSDIKTIAGVTISGDTTVHAGMANVYYDFDQLNPNFSPYIGGGIGYARVDTSVVGTGSNNTFAFQGIAGVSYNVNSNLGLFADYRYFGTTKAKKALGNKRYQNNIFSIGLSYHFGGEVA